MSGAAAHRLDAAWTNMQRQLFGQVSHRHPLRLEGRVIVPVSATASVVLSAALRAAAEADRLPAPVPRKRRSRP